MQETATSADPAAGSLDERLAARRDALSPTEQRVADFFARHREEAAFLSATEIAQRLGTSDASVVRTAQSLGYSGLQELKREFATTLRSRATPALRLGRRLSELGTHGEHALDQAIALQIELLEDVRRTVTPDAFARALAIVEAARRVLIFGTGPSATPAAYFALRLARFGRDALAITSTGIQLADALIGVRAGDAVVAMGYGRVTRELDVTLDRARACGVPVVLLTDTLGAALADRVAVSLRARWERSGMFGSIATTLVLIDGLLMGLAARDRASSLAALAALNDLRAKIAGYRVDIGGPIADGPIGQEGGSPPGLPDT
jgi:DNA-binding MurR/RpiR family transcriptional regulator